MPVSRLFNARYLTAFVVVLAFAASNAAAQVELNPRVFEIAGKLRCPVCISESVAQSDSGTSREMRQLISDKLAAGESEAEIFAFFVERYGDWILLEPPRRGYYWVVWLAPVVVGLGLAALVAYFVLRWTRRSGEQPEADPDYLAQVQDDLAAGTGEGGTSV